MEPGRRAITIRVRRRGHANLDGLDLFVPATKGTSSLTAFRTSEVLGLSARGRAQQSTLSSLTRSAMIFSAEGFIAFQSPNLEVWADA